MLKNEYINELIPNIFKENMRKHFEKNISEVIKTENGFLIPFGKPDIKTRFWFSYDEHTSGSIEAAQEACDIKEDAFIYENTKELKEKIKRFEKAEKIFFRNRYDKTEKIKEVLLIDYVEKFYWEKFTEGTESDKKIIIEALKNELAKFEKRLKTYLKRYGTEKLTTRTYSTWDYYQKGK